MRKTIRVLLCMGLLIIPSVVVGEVYKWVDDKGGVHFTDDYSTIPEKYRQIIEKRTLQEDSSSKQPIQQQKSLGKIIDMDGYSISSPMGSRWTTEIEKEKRTVTFKKHRESSITPYETLIRVIGNGVKSVEWPLSEEEVANDFRNMQESDMLERGVKKGLYDLKEVKKGTTTIGNKKLYFMTYKTLHHRGPLIPKIAAENALYLFFPVDFRVTHLFYVFLIADYSEQADLTQIVPVINSLKISEGEGRPGPFDFDRRLAIYREHNEIADGLRRSTTGSRDEVVLKTKETKTFKGFPSLTLLDLNKDGKPEQFLYLRPGGSETNEHGFMFDLNKDGKIDYVVFNGGPLCTKDIKFVWMNYHMIDSNFDGKIDIVVYNDVDLDGDKFVDEGLTAWIYDSNYDGKIDKAEYLKEGINKPVEKIHGAFIIKRVMGDIEFSESTEDLFVFPNMVFYDINSLLERQ